MLLIGAGLVGCSSSPSDVQATPTPTFVEAVSYGTVQEFAEALEAAGADCRFEQTNAVANAAESGSCGSSLTLMTFTGAESREPRREHRRPQELRGSHRHAPARGAELGAER